jgi:prophage regulatory protein
MRVKLTKINGNEDIRIVREKECLYLTGLSRSTRRRMEKTGQFPRRRQLSEHSTGWVYGEIRVWLAARVESG